MTPEETQTAQPETFQFFHRGLKKTIDFPATIGTGENAVSTKAIIEGIIAESRTEARGGLTQKLKEYESQLSDYEETKARLAELEGSTMTAEQRLKKEQDRAQAEIKKREELAAKYRSELHSEKLQNALFKEVSKNPEIYNAEQAMRLFQAECAPELVESDDGYQIVANLDGNKIALSESFQKWISKESNANLLKNKLTPGGGSSGGQRGAVKGTITRAQFDALGTLEKAEAIKNGVNITD